MRCAARIATLMQVPCCVYRKEFPRRRLPGSTGELRPVRSHEDLLDWLALKHPRTRRQQLDFEGRNTVLYTLPDDMAPGAAEVTFETSAATTRLGSMQT